MKPTQPPKLEPRREEDFERELVERARAWSPAWSVDDEHDFGRALLRIAALFGSEVARRLDGAGAKMRLGLLDWLGMRGEAARPARMPVVFKMAAKTLRPFLARAPLRMQVEVRGTPVVFESESDVRLVPGLLDRVLAADADTDEIFLQPPGLTQIEPGPAEPAQWRLKSFASAESAELQLDPAEGLALEIVVEIGGGQHRVIAVNENIVSIDPPVPPGDGFAADTPVRRVSAFEPFGGARNRQEHALYLGDEALLDIQAAATLDVVGAQALGIGDGVSWQYWGKRASDDGTPDDEVGWQTLEPIETQKNDAVVLGKPKGAVEPVPVDGRPSRWIRAWTKTVDGSTPRLSTSTPLGLRINAPPDSPPVPASAPPPPDPADLPPLDVIVNTAAQTTRDFHPLGQQPRQFDSLYLGCAEAFSKHGARAAVHFDLAEPVFAVLSSIDAGAGGLVVGGVDKAGALQLFGVGDTALSPLRPATRPSRTGDAAVQGTRLTSQHLRAPMWIDGGTGDLLVAVAAGSHAWVWRENFSSPSDSGWTPLGEPPARQDPSTGIQSLALMDDAGSIALVAVRDQRIHRRTWGGDGWVAMAADDPGGPPSTPLDIEAVSTVMRKATGEPSPEILAVDAAGRLFAVSDAATQELMTDLAPPVPLALDVLPVGRVRADGTPEVAAVGASHAELLAWQSAGLDFQAGTSTSQALDPGDTIQGETVGTQTPSGQPLIDASGDGPEWTVVALARSAAGSPLLLSWRPFDPDLSPIVFRTRADPGIGTPGGCPTLLAARAYLPGTTPGEILAIDTPERSVRTAPSTSFRSALARQDLSAPLASGDLIATVNGADRGAATIAAAPPVRGIRGFDTETFLWLESYLPRPDAGPEPVHWFRGASSFSTSSISGSVLDRDPSDGVSEAGGGFIVIGDAASGFEVAEVDGPASDATQLQLDITPTADPTLGAVPYRWAEGTFSARILPALKLDASNDDWQSDALQHGVLYLPDLSPDARLAAAVEPAPASPPAHLAFAAPWLPPPPPPGQLDFIVDSQAGAWTRVLRDDSSNPALAWEYWNGTGWWRLTLDRDETNHLKNSGEVSFRVPDDLEATDWAGHTNHWVRARLIGGDYGRESVIVTTVPSPPPTGATTQTYDRVTAGIQAPYVLEVWVRYAIEDAVIPGLVVAADSLSFRDQSDANRSAGAIVEAFVPLSVSLGRLLRNRGTAGPSDGKAEVSACPSADAPGGATTADGALPAASPARGRSLFLGFDAPLWGEPVNTLLLVASERDHEDFAPLVAEALIGDRFEPLVAEDETRAVGESGLLTLSFPDPPGPAGLFGKELRWVRLTHRPNAVGAWEPSLRGAYLNAVWSSATETLTRELLGSSEGAPNLSLRLARPPLLRDSLVLRVRERLGDDQREAMLRQDPESVLHDPNLPGDWVLWERVGDPADEGPGRRVYALDEASGVVRFGDGLHGAIPPTGRDSIVAFSYQRTEPPIPGSLDVPANAVEARTKINLVTPVLGAEAAFSADRAAGGAPPDSVDHVLRFATSRLRHRGRALTARDLEDLALQSSPSIVQARALDAGGRVRLVVVLRGRQPTPGEAQKRELERLLLDAAPPFLSSGRLEIRGPRLRPLRISLRLRVASLDSAGSVADEVRRRLQSLFDTATGGASGLGWPLGATPREEDLVLAMLDVPGLSGISDVEWSELRDGEPQPWPASLAPHELAWLASDGIRIGFEGGEVAA